MNKNEESDLNLMTIFLSFLNFFIFENERGLFFKKGTLMNKESIFPIYLIPVAITNLEYEQILEELSEIIYESLYPSVPELLERTGKNE